MSKCAHLQLYKGSVKVRKGVPGKIRSLTGFGLKVLMWRFIFFKGIAVNYIYRTRNVTFIPTSEPEFYSVTLTLSCITENDMSVCGKEAMLAPDTRGP